MKVISEFTIAANSGQAFVVRQGQYLKVVGTTTADFIILNLNNVRERFDQARTKTNQGKIFLSTGDWLDSKYNNPMMFIVEDGYKEGTHDLQKGTCSRSRWELSAKRGLLGQTYLGRDRIEMFPDHGCWENLTEALRPWNIPPEDIPSPFNLFQTMKIDGATGRMEHTRVRPPAPAAIIFRAEMDCLGAISACPDTIVGGKAIDVVIYEEES
ncbi:MAG: urea carboxylase-associated family protein [Chloroflexi bacterium]|nr:urea carboxylase-associated family protein [Chloroflexota bacterium]